MKIFRVCAAIIIVIILFGTFITWNESNIKSRREREDVNVLIFTANLTSFETISSFWGDKYVLQFDDGHIITITSSISEYIQIGQAYNVYWNEWHNTEILEKVKQK